RVLERMAVAVVVALAHQRGDVVAGAERAPLAAQHDAARVERGEGGGQRVEQRAVERAALGGVGDRQPRDARRRLGDVQPPAGRVRLVAGAVVRAGHYSSTTSVSPSETASPSWQRTSFTTPASSASTGISIFIDSRTTTVSPSSTASPTSTSTLQTVPVMWASTSATVTSSTGAERGAAPRALHRGGTIAACSDAACAFPPDGRRHSADRRTRP